MERREEILNVALSVLAERGYRGASMREIAKRAQASKETLYAWFGDKRGLFEELVSWQAHRLEAVLVEYFLYELLTQAAAIPEMAIPTTITTI